MFDLFRLRRNAAGGDSAGGLAHLDSKRLESGRARWESESPAGAMVALG